MPAPRRTPLIALVLVAIGWGRSVAAFADPAIDADSTVYLPNVTNVQGMGAPDVCSRAAPCSDVGGWALHCGGFGRVRDAFTRTAGDDVRKIVAVGDGVAIYDAVTRSWLVQIGRDLSGLLALHLGEEGGGEGWAVGERTRLARFDGDGCWSADDTLINGHVTLSSVVFEAAEHRGWAVGRRDAQGVLLRMRDGGGRPVWSDASGLVAGGLPPLTDFSLSNLTPPVYDAWLVSEDASQLLQARLGTTADGARDVAEVIDRIAIADRTGRPARPREIAMRHDEGWLSGEARTDADLLAVETWRNVGGGVWRPESEVLPGRSTVDLYFDSSQWPGRWWLGLTPDPKGLGVLRTTEVADGSRAWVHWDSAGPDVAGRTDDQGHRAIAPLREGRVLYAWGDSAWIYDSSKWDWDEVLRRRRLIGVAPHSSGAWVLAAPMPGEPDEPQLMAWDGASLRPVVQLDGHSGPMPELTAIASGSGTAWAVGVGGAGLRQQGATGWWVSMPGAEGVARFEDVSVAADGGTWAVGSDVDARSGLWQFDDTARSWQRKVATDGRLVAAAALPGGLAWAVGDGIVCECVGGSCRCEDGLSYARAPGDDPVALLFRAVAAVETPGGPVVWASGDSDGTSYLVQRSATGWRDAPARLLAGLPQGAMIADLSGGAADDIWSVATCHPYEDAQRGVTIVNRFRGAGDVTDGRIDSLESLALSVPARSLVVRTTGTDARTVWVAGDWSTLLSLAYDSEGPAQALHMPPVPDLRCAPVVGQGD